MRFEDEQYVRLYKRDTTTWLMLNWQGRCILPLVLRKVDRAGILDLGEDGYEALAAHIQVPLEVVEAGMTSILARKILMLREDGVLVWPRFIEAQEAKQSDKARQKAARDKARDVAAANQRGVTVRNAPSRDVTDCTPDEQNVTAGHTASQPVTLSCDQPSNEQPSARDELSQPTSGSHRVGSFEIPEGVARFERPDWIAAYTAGIRRVSSGFTFKPQTFDTLKRVVSARLPPDSRSNISVWIEADAERFARAVAAKPQVWSGYSADGWERWWNSGCPTETGRGPSAPSAASQGKKPPYLVEWVDPYAKPAGGHR